MRGGGAIACSLWARRAIRLRVGCRPRAVPASRHTPSVRRRVRSRSELGPAVDPRERKGGGEGGGYWLRALANLKAAVSGRTGQRPSGVAPMGFTLTGLALRIVGSLCGRRKEGGLGGLCLSRDAGGKRRRRRLRHRGFGRVRRHQRRDHRRQDIVIPCRPATKC